MRKAALFALCALLLGCSALAEIPCICGLEACLCFVQLGDEGMAVEAIQNELVAQGWLAPKDDASSFDENTRQAVIAFQAAHALPTTGMMDDNTLTLLLWGVLPDELDIRHPESSALPMWIPTDGGIRHHDTPTCSKMHDPRLVSQRNALAMNMLHCGRCKPFGYIK